MEGRRRERPAVRLHRRWSLWRGTPTPDLPRVPFMYQWLTVDEEESAAPRLESMSLSAGEGRALWDTKTKATCLCGIWSGGPRWRGRRAAQAGAPPYPAQESHQRRRSGPGVSGQTQLDPRPALVSGGLPEPGTRHRTSQAAA